ncbi:MAG: SpoIIE family protein phosphatase [Candidatus Velthaea sp.]|jgi:serine phosphatase RsbU (regulator of sigma subunit)/DNA-binding NarL/FixJ family response regulator
MSRRRKVLLIDDSPEDLATYSAYLLSSPDSLVVATASSSVTGLQLCTAFAPDCLVIDLHIDALDGLAVLEHARERAGYVPTIILTGQGNERLAVESLKRGAWNYLVKGETSATALAQAVHEALDADALRQELVERRRTEERARAELETAYARARFLAAISEILISSLDRETIVATVVREVIANVADACFVDLVAGSGLTRIGGAHPDDAPHLDGREGVARVMRSGEPALYGRAWLDTVLPCDADLARLAGAGLHSALIVPLTFDRGAFGAVTFAAVGSRPVLSSDDIPHFMELGRRLSAAIVNADLYNAERRARTAAESAKRRLTIVSQASSLFARSLDWQETLQRLARALVPRFADWTGIFVVDGDSAAGLKLVASRHADTARADTYARLFEPLAATIGETAIASSSGPAPRPEYFPHGLPEPDAAGTIGALRAGGVRSYMSVPLIARGQLWGSFVVLNDGERDSFELDDLSLLEDLGRRIATYLESASISRREREIAHTLQRSLMPDTIPAFDDLGFATRYLPGMEGVHVGGDWYDAFAVDERCVAFVIGDVSGRGVRAAAIMGNLRATVRAYLLDGFGPAAVLERANRASEGIGFDHFATVLCAILDRGTGSLTFANAGHPPPLLITNHSCAVLDHEPGPPIGVVRNPVYADIRVHIEAGATFLLYTDGLIESRKRAASDGILELCEQAKRGRDDDLEMYVDNLLAAMTGGRHDDDVAIVAVRRLPAASEACLDSERE